MYWSPHCETLLSDETHVSFSFNYDHWTVNKQCGNLRTYCMWDILKVWLWAVSQLYHWPLLTPDVGETAVSYISYNTAIEPTIYDMLKHQTITHTLYIAVNETVSIGN